MIMPLPLNDDGTPLQQVLINTGALPLQQDQDQANAVGFSAPDALDNIPTKATILDKLLGTNDQTRYQLWPEKLIRDALSAPHDVMQQNPHPEGTEENLAYENLRQGAMPQAALNMSALAGTGGLGGVGEGAGTALGAGPIFRTAKNGYELLKNPSSRELEGAISKSNSNGVRVMIDPKTNNIYAFDNLKYTHDMVAKELKAEGVDLPYSMGNDKISVNDYHILPQKDGTYVIGGGNASDANIVDLIQSNLNLERILKNKGVRLTKNGDEFEDALAHSKYNGWGDIVNHDEDISDLFKRAPINLLSDSSLPGAGIAANNRFLRPALKYEGKIYKAPVGGEHMDAIPKDLQPEFTRQAMSGEDISNFNFGFMNHKGHFLSREDALKYAIDNGLINPHDAKYGALTSTMDFKPQFENPTKLIDWTPAIKVKDKIYKGQDHPTIQEKNQLYGVSQTDGFVDSKGNFLNRNDFNKKFGTNESYDLNSIKEVLKNNPEIGAQ